MSSIKLDIDGEEITISKELLLQMNNFKDFPKLTTIDPFYFKMLIALLNPDNTKREIAKLCDSLGLTTQVDYIIKFYCKTKNCNKICIDNTFCNKHKCPLPNCENEKYKTYCDLHTCINENCNNMTQITIPYCNVNYCLNHKCTIEDCLNYRGDDDYCIKHKCRVSKCNNFALNGNLCENHKCISNNCEYLAYGSRHCIYHKCIIIDCPHAKVNKHHCSEHK